MTDPTAPAAAAGAPARVRFWRSLFCERDNLTGDLKRVLWALAVLWGLGLETWWVVRLGRAFDLVNFSLGVSGLLAAGAGALALNRKNENGAAS